MIAAPPAIGPPPERDPSPFWSVMIPVYNPERRYLSETLQGVLNQDPGPQTMQICVVDDASPASGVAELVRELGPGRVEYFRRETNGGLARAWNTAIEQASGRWVHLLHQDDLVFDGFYGRLEDALQARDELGAAYVQHRLIDEDGRAGALMSSNPAQEAGVVVDWMELIFARLSFQTPAVVVRRDVYERLGGFRPDLRYALDWDMWKRIAAEYPFWYAPEPLAGYRRHVGAVSTEFLRSGENMAEIRRSIEIAAAYLPQEKQSEMLAAASAHWREMAVDEAIRGLFSLGDGRIARAQLAEARKFGGGGSLPALVARRFAAAMGRWARDRFAGGGRVDA